MKWMQSSDACPPWGLCVERGQTLLRAGATGPVWRVTQGAFCLEREARDGPGVVQLALPGDFVGVEALCQETYTCNVTALTGSMALVMGNVHLAQTRLLAAVVRQQQRQTLDMTLLRSGPVVGRLRHLLSLLVPSADSPLERTALPALKDMAQIVASTPETVCRELNRLLPARPRHVLARARHAWAGAAMPLAVAC